MNYTDEFEQFWKKYPKRWNKDYQGGSWVKRKKAPAFKVWRKLPQEIRDRCLRIAGKIKQSEGGAVRDCVTWLNQEGWDDIDEPEVVQHLPEEMTNNVFKVVHHHIDINERRNTETRKLKI